MMFIGQLCYASIMEVFTLCYINNFMYFYYTTMQHYFTYASDIDDKRERFCRQYFIYLIHTDLYSIYFVSEQR